MASAAGSVTEQQITDFIAAHAEHVPETRDVRMVTAQQKAVVLAARAALQRGATWQRVAYRYSDDRSNRRHGGLTRDLPRAALLSQVAGRVFHAKPHVLIGPIHTRRGWTNFEVARIHTARITHPSRATAKDVLRSDAEQSVLDAFVKSFTAKRTARTTCAAAYTFSAACGNHT